MPPQFDLVSAKFSEEFVDLFNRGGVKEPYSKKLDGSNSIWVFHSCPQATA